MSTKYMVLGYKDYVICDDSLRIVHRGKVQSGLMLDIRLNYYRGFHLSCISEFGLKIDGKVVPPGNVKFLLNGNEYAYEQLPDLYTVFWGIKQRVTLEAFTGPIEDGEHDIELTLRFRCPYMQYAPGVYATVDSSARKTLTLRHKYISPAQPENDPIQEKVR